MLRKFLIPVISIMLVIMAAACSSNTQSSAGSREKAEKTDLKELDGFDWKRFNGEEINVMLNQHPYAEAIVERLPEFEELTGIKVNHSVTPEESYFDKLTTALNAENGNPDVFMTGSYQLWEYAPAGYIQELDSFISDENRTNEDYDADDFFEGVLDADRWDLTPGHEVGTGNLWAVPLAFELNLLHYNKRAFEEAGITAPPKTFDELIEVASKLEGWNGEGSYGVGVRGTRSWATIHPGYMTSFANHGAKDFVIEDGKLVSKLNSPESVEITEKFVELVKTAGPKDWSNYTWYQVATDLAAGKAAMAYDASNWSLYYNVEGSSEEAGNLAVTLPPTTKEGEPGANMWVWSIAMNKSSEKKDAAWLFMQYFTGKEHMLWGATEANVVDPVRQSVWDNEAFKERISLAEGYEETFQTLIENSTIKFTPQPEFFNVTTEWASALQDIVNGSDAQERMDTLTEEINKRVERLRVEE
ncbi:ABC transporter substrate-binding protein [Metabacillus bambusae]|uniref:Sugar ABC transporter substrate-binding protein n=1 Tax=Metabacillus bambusae TaxID=2795218 RepID=A0ABS3NB67_9BACI|nr:sugar ABC transporter substrate-binding protein [Metabacillus bambusae]MBO1515527.1 sugar ABC transporter substrate-binding protein [Metabacillus bambusae]